VISYGFALVDAFSVNLAKRTTWPVLHFTVFVNPAIFGLDDQPHVLAFLTETAKVTEPPEALTVFVAAPACVAMRPPRQSAAVVTLTTILRFIETS
jgi:hypothetical protein